KLYGPFVALALLVLIGIWANPDSFLTPNNLINVLTRTAFTGVIAVGATFVITSGGIDLSVGSLAAFIAGVMIMALNALNGQGFDPLAAVLVGVALAMLLGAAAGVVNGLLVTKGRIEPFIVTLGTMGIYRS
ncbi:ABC transporter permease, partial [Mycobacterium tuberculosis]|nr:ABC transporter permease [Mycobacterium tuberculosis]